MKCLICRKRVPKKENTFRCLDNTFLHLNIEEKDGKYFYIDVYCKLQDTIYRLTNSHINQTVYVPFTIIEKTHPTYKVILEDYGQCLDIQNIELIPDLIQRYLNLKAFI